MPLKFSIANLVLGAALAASAAEVVCVECRSNLKETVVAAAWGKSAKVESVVDKSDLAAGAKVLRWDGKAWQAWALDAKGWKPCAAGDRKAPAKDGGLAKGTSFVLVRSADLEKPFTVNVPADAKCAALERGTEDGEAATLVAGPFDVDYDFNERGVSEWQDDGAAAQDAVRIWDDDAWQEVGFKAAGVTVDTTGWGKLAKEEGEEFEKGAVVPKATAFWYVSRGGETTPVLNW